MTTVVAVASSTISKVLATQKAFEDLHVGVIDFPIDSDVSDQPIGELETRKGAQNRLAKLKRKYTYNNTTPDYLVSIENGLIQCGDGSWHDIAVVMVYNFSNCKEATIYSAGIPTDFQGPDDLNRYRNQIKRFREMHNVTAAFTNFLVTREQVLSQAIRIARGRTETEF